MNVELSWAEVRMAATIGIEQFVYAIYNSRRNRAGLPADRGWSEHVVGALGELAVARLLRTYPRFYCHPVYSGDIGRLEIRATARADGSLIIRPTDPDDRPFILVRGGPPVFDIAGWIMGSDAKQPSYIRDPSDRSPAYFVPTAALRPIYDLPAKYIPAAEVPF